MCILLITTDFGIEVPQNACLEASSDVCVLICRISWLGGVDSARALIAAPNSDPSASFPCSAAVTQFERSLGFGLSALDVLSLRCLLGPFNVVRGIGWRSPRILLSPPLWWTA